MRQAEFFMEYGAYQGFTASPENQTESQMYLLMIKEKETVKVRLGVFTSVTLNSRVSGVDEYNVYDWLWNQGLNFLETYEKDNGEIKDITLLIDGDMVTDGEIRIPWDALMTESTDEEKT